ncbi:MAG: thiolase family protein [Actinomycetota bacterium]
MASDDVAIVGIGIHPFGRHDATGLEQGTHAAREALADAGSTWEDMQFAFGGSTAAGQADIMVNNLGLSGLPFINVVNGCATGGSALISAVNAIRSGAFDVGMAVGFDKHPRGAFDPKPGDWGIGDWYGDTGMMLTTQFFGMKIQRYMHDHDISHSTLAKVSAKAFRNAEKNPNAWRRKPFSEEEILEAPMLSHPLTQYMFCSPGEGGVALVLARADKAHEYTDTPIFVRAATVRTRRYGTFEVFNPSLAIDRTDAPTVDAARAAFEQAGIEPGDVDVAQIQDTEAGAEVMHMSENLLCADGEQEELIQTGATEIDGSLPINTDGGCIANGEPIGASGLRQVYENVLQLRGRAGDRQVPNDPQVGYTHVYGAPGLSAVTILSR